MLERDLERAAAIHLEIGQINDCIGVHREFGRYLDLAFLLPRKTKKKDGTEETATDVTAVSFALQLNSDEVTGRANMLLNEMLQEKLKCKRLELKRLGIKLEEELPADTKPKDKTKL